MKVSPISSYPEGCPYHRCRDEREEQEERRRWESLLWELRGWQPDSPSDGRYRWRIHDWKVMASDLLCDLYSLRQAADAISQRYLDGQDLLFPAHTRSLARLVEVAEELVAGDSEDLGNELEQESGPAPDEPEGARAAISTNITRLQEAVLPAARRHTAFLVDMARAEALDALGENRAAVAIADRHV